MWLQYSVFFPELVVDLVHEEYKDYTRALLGVFSWPAPRIWIDLDIRASHIAVCRALFSLVATGILWICFASFNRLCGLLQHANLATLNHRKHEPLKHSPWPWPAFFTHPATMGKLRMYCMAACPGSVVYWPAMSQNQVYWGHFQSKPEVKSGHYGPKLLS